MEKNTLQFTQAWSQTWDEEAVAGVHYKTMKGQVVPGCQSQSFKPSRVERDGI